LVFLPQLLYAEAILVPDIEVFEKAKVLKVLNIGTTTIAGTNTPLPTQTLTIEVVAGKGAGTIAMFKSDYRVENIKTPKISIS
jgi:hypothetical protein